MNFEIECEREDDGRWLSEVPQLPGVLAYGDSANDAMARAQILALRVLTERLENNETGPQAIAKVRTFRFGIRARLKSAGISRHRLVASIAAACIAASVHAAEIRVISAAPLSGVLDELGAQFEREAGHRIVRKFVSGPLVKREVETGEAYDVAISVGPVVGDLGK